MKTWVTRTRLAQLIGRDDTVRRSTSGRWLTDLTAESIKARMPADQRALLVGTMSGGDDSLACSTWLIPGIGRRTVTVNRDALCSIISKAEPWSPPVPPEVEARRILARDRLRSLRQLAAVEGQGRLL